MSRQQIDMYGLFGTGWYSSICTSSGKHCKCGNGLHSGQIIDMFRWIPVINTANHWQCSMDSIGLDFGPVLKLGIEILLGRHAAKSFQQNTISKLGTSSYHKILYCSFRLKSHAPQIILRNDMVRNFYPIHSGNHQLTKTIPCNLLKGLVMHKTSETSREVKQKLLP